MVEQTRTAVKHPALWLEGRFVTEQRLARGPDDFRVNDRLYEKLAS